MNAHYPAETITIAKVHLERRLSIEVALAHAWILPLIDLPLLGMRFFLLIVRAFVAFFQVIWFFLANLKYFIQRLKEH